MIQVPHHSVCSPRIGVDLSKVVFEWRLICCSRLNSPEIGDHKHLLHHFRAGGGEPLGSADVGPLGLRSPTKAIGCHHKLEIASRIPDIHNDQFVLELARTQI